MNSKLPCIALLLLTSLSNLCAQAQPEEHKVRFRTIGWQVSFDDLYYEIKGHDANVFVTESSRSIFYDAPKEKQFVFYRLVPGTDDPSKKTREVAATVDISNAGHVPLLLFIVDPAAPKHYRVTAFPDDPKSFPFPSCRFINLTGVDLHATYGEEKFEVKGRGLAMVYPKLKDNAESDAQYTTVSMDSPHGPQLLYCNNWVMCSKQRTLVFIFPQEDRMNVLRVSDDKSTFPSPPK